MEMSTMLAWLPNDFSLPVPSTPLPGVADGEATEVASWPATLAAKRARVRKKRMRVPWSVAESVDRRDGDDLLAVAFVAAALILARDIGRT